MRAVAALALALTGCSAAAGGPAPPVDDPAPAASVSPGGPSASPAGPTRVAVAQRPVTGVLGASCQADADCDDLAKDLQALGLTYAAPPVYCDVWHSDNEPTPQCTFACSLGDPTDAYCHQLGGFCAPGSNVSAQGLRPPPACWL